MSFLSYLFSALPSLVLNARLSELSSGPAYHVVLRTNILASGPLVLFRLLSTYARIGQPAIYIFYHSVPTLLSSMNCFSVIM